MHTQSALGFTTIEPIPKDEMTRSATINNMILNDSKFENNVVKDLC